MANISLLSRLVNGIQRQVDLSANTLVVDIIKVGGGAGTDLTKTILDKLILINTAADADGTFDTRYTQITNLASATASSGSDLVGDDNTYSNFTPSAATVKGALEGIDSAIATAGGTTFLDSVFRVQDDLDNTKQIAFQASGLTTATTRTITMPDADVDLGNLTDSNIAAAAAIALSKLAALTANRALASDVSGIIVATAVTDTELGYLSGVTSAIQTQFSGKLSLSGGTMTGAINGGGFEASNFATPTATSSLATKGYVDNLANGVNWKQTVRSATTTTLPAYTYTSGVITATANGALTAQDGVTLIVGDRLLVKDEVSTNQPYNGIYTVTATGDVSNPYVLTRALDSDTAAELQWETVEVSPDATTQAGYVYRESLDIVTIGTDNVSYSLLSKGLAWVFGNGLTTSGNNVSVLASDNSILVGAGGVSVKEDTAGAIVTGASGIKVQLEATTPTLQIDGSNQLGAKLNAAGAIVTGASGLAVNVDGSSIDIATNAIEIKAQGVSAAKLGADVAGDGLSGGSGTAIAFSATATAGTGLENDGSNNLRIASAAFDQATITGGAGTAAAVQNAPLLQKAAIVGKVFAANNTTYAMRWGNSSNAVVASGVVTVSTTISSTAATLSASNASIAVGQYIVSANIPAGTTVAAVSGTSLTLSAAATATASGTAIAFNEAADNIYPADDDTASLDLFYVVGVVNSGASGTTLTPGVTTFNLVALGDYTLASSDTVFAYTSVGTPVFLTSAGAFSITAPTTAGLAVVRIGMIHNTNKMWISPNVIAVN